MIRVIYENNDMVIEVKGLKDVVTGAYVNDASASFEVYKSNGQLEGNGTWPIAMSYVAGTRGVYRGVMPAYLDLEYAETIDVVISILDGSAKAEFRETVKVRRRT